MPGDNRGYAREPIEMIGMCPKGKLWFDVLKRDGYKQLQGKRVALVTNQTGRDREGNRLPDLLFAAPDVKLVLAETTSPLGEMTSCPAVYAVVGCHFGTAVALLA